RYIEHTAPASDSPNPRVRMHAPAPTPAPSESTAGWWRDLSGYHWFVLIACAFGWLFDTMDQQLFNLARPPAVAQLLAKSPLSDSFKSTFTSIGFDLSNQRGVIQLISGLTTMIFMIGWATGGIIFGVLGDRIGRAKTMMLTIL